MNASVKGKASGAVALYSQKADERGNSECPTLGKSTGVHPHQDRHPGAQTLETAWTESFSNEEPWDSHNKWWHILGEGFEKLQVLWKQLQSLATGFSVSQQWASPPPHGRRYQDVWNAIPRTRGQAALLTSVIIENLRLLLQELTPANWSQIPAWVIPSSLPKIPRLFQTDVVFFTSSIEDCWVALCVVLSTCCVSPQRRLQHPGNGPVQSFGTSHSIWGQCWAVFSVWELLNTLPQSCGLQQTATKRQH